MKTDTKTHGPGALLTQREAARALGMSPATIRAMIREGQIGTVPVGKLQRIPYACVAKWAGKTQEAAQ